MVMVMGMALVVNICLLYAAGKAVRETALAIRMFLAAAIGALFVGTSIIPEVAFTKHWLWRLLGLVLTGAAAFGVRGKAWWNTFLFVLLQLSLGGIAERSVTVSMMLGAAGVGLACLLLNRNQNFVPVELKYGEQTLQLTALRDTGHSLRDPVTGKSVLVVGADTAQQLTGLHPHELRDPVRTLETMPGLRLIPYQSVGNSGFLLAIFVPQAKIGGKQGSAIVALSPNLFGSNYQALTGGMV